MSILNEIHNGENKKLEFKQQFPTSLNLAKTTIAFANTGGGRLLIGVSDSGDILGIAEEDLHPYMDRISNILHDMIHPLLIPDLYTYTLNNKTIIIIEVYPSTLRPHFLKAEGKMDGTYVRVGATNKKADFEYIQELERIKLNLSYDKDVWPGHNEDSSLDEKLLNLLSEKLDRDITESDLYNLHLKMKVGNEWRFTNGAIILLGLSENVEIKCARFKGVTTDVFIDQKVIKGNLFDQIDAAMKFLLTNIHLNGQEGEDFLKREDVYEIPPAIFREALTNAIVHRDYATMHSGVRIAVFDDRIEITSPGDFPRGITVEEAIAGRSEIRNWVITRIFKEAGYIEQWGRGLNRIFNLSKEAGLETPEIFESGMFVQVRIHRKVEKAGRKSRPQKQAAKAGRKSRPQKLELYYNLLYEAYKLDYFNVSDFEHLTGLSKSRATAILSQLVTEKKLQREGFSKNTRYKVIQCF